MISTKNRIIYCPWREWRALEALNITYNWRQFFYQDYTVWRRKNPIFFSNILYIFLPFCCLIAILQPLILWDESLASLHDGKHAGLGQGQGKAAMAADDELVGEGVVYVIGEQVDEGGTGGRWRRPFRCAGASILTEKGVTMEEDVDI